MIGGGIAGVGAAARVAAEARVLVLEREPSVGYHTTGRSAAMLRDNYGNAVIRRCTPAGGRFPRAPIRNSGLRR